MAAPKPVRRSVDEYIDELPPAVSDIASRVRAAVTSAAPQAAESVKYGQAVYEDNGPFVALKAFAKHVTLTFWRGGALADPDHVLEGDGDRMKHVRFASPEDVRPEAIGDLVRAAVKMNRELGDPTKKRTR